MSSRRRGPALVYIDSAGTRHHIDTQALNDPRERAICRALLDLAGTLADTADQPSEKPRPIGFTATSDTQRSGD